MPLLVLLPAPSRVALALSHVGAFRYLEVNLASCAVQWFIVMLLLLDVSALAKGIGGGIRERRVVD